MNEPATLWHPDDAEGSMLLRALAIADVPFARIVAAHRVPRLALSDGTVLDGSIGILTYLQDLAPALRPTGFDRYRIAEWINAIATEVIKPAMLARWPNLPEARSDALRHAVSRQLGLITAQLGQSGRFLDQGPCIADLYLAYARSLVDQ